MNLHHYDIRLKLKKLLLPLTLCLSSLKLAASFFFSCLISAQSELKVLKDCLHEMVENSYYIEFRANREGSVLNKAEICPATVPVLLALMAQNTHKNLIKN